MSTEVEKFDPSRLVEDVRKRVQATFASMIPEEEWNKLVTREIRLFMNGEVGSSPQYDRPSGLGKLVREEMDSFFRQQIKNELATPVWTASWMNTSKPLASEMVTKLMTENAPAIFAAAFGGMFQAVIEGMKYQR